MKANIKAVALDINNNVILHEIQAENIMLTEKAVLAIDGSTTNTGISILREKDGALYFSIAATREKDNGETPVQYKVRLKRLVFDILLRNPAIETVYYEEPFIGYTTAAPNLLMLRTFVEEIIVENEPALDYIKHSEINNMRWKKLFLAPDKCPQGTELQKAAARKKLVSFLPFMADVTQDEIDATAMGYIATVKMKDGTEEDLESKKKAHPFQYNIRFIGADDDDNMIQEFYDIYNGPSILLQNGILLTDISSTANFDKTVYEKMGQDDKILIIKFPSNRHANLILQYKIGALAATYDFLYGVIWRKSRK